MPDPSPFSVLKCYCKAEKYKSPGGGQIPAEQIPARGEILLPGTHKLIHSVWNKEEMPDKWNESIFVPIYQLPTVVIIVEYHHQLRTKFCQIYFSQG
jgi:hypothetical protein